MSDGLRFTAAVVGDDKLKQRFLDIEGSLRVHLRDTLGAIGQTLRDRLASAAPRATGSLAASFRARQRETDFKLTETVSPGKFYARFLEYGVVNHGSRNNRVAVLREDLRRMSIRRGLVAVVRWRRAQGQYRIFPHPFIHPIWNEMKDGVQDEMAVAVAAAIAET